MTTERVVSQLLAELDGVEQLSRVAVIGATNRIELIDPSIIRPGRFGVHIHVGLPDEGGRAAILRIGLRRSKFADPRDLDAIVETAVPLSDGFSGAEIRYVCDEAKRMAIKATGFTSAAPPTIAHVLDALQATRRAKTEGVNQNG